MSDVRYTDYPGDCSSCGGEGCDDCSDTGCDCGEVMNKTVMCDRCEHIFEDEDT